ncbi:MAG: nucleotidyltransferase [Candidatus Latescibacterota bacterium]|nr:MAG: nucleotidyltransferase [Candidatus Latescibacterota bacterium]
MIEELKNFFEKYNEVKLVYLFGSYAKGETNKLSDIDIAVYLDERLSKKDKFRLQLKLISELSSLLKTDKIDLIIMNETPLLLNYNIIKDGIILKSEEKLRVKIESEVMSKYLDRKYYDDRHVREKIKRIARYGLA